MLRFGPDTGPVAVVALPLFEEANRMRAFAVTLCRLLAKRGVASVLPDLPGQGESLVQTHDACLANMRCAFGDVFELLFAQKRRAYSASITSGALVTVEAHALGRWHLSPIAGHDILQDFGRVLKVSGRDEDFRLLANPLQGEESAFPMEIAGNHIGLTLLEELATEHTTFPLKTVGIPLRTVRLDTDAKPADRHVPGPPLWRRAEPGNDPALAALLAEDVAEWIARCEG